MMTTTLEKTTDPDVEFSHLLAAGADKPRRTPGQPEPLLGAPTEVPVSRAEYIAAVGEDLAQNK